MSDATNKAVFLSYTSQDTRYARSFEFGVVPGQDLPLARLSIDVRVASLGLGLELADRQFAIRTGRSGMPANPQ